MLILGLLGMYFDAAVVFVTNSSLLFRLAVAILCLVSSRDQIANNSKFPIMNFEFSTTFLTKYLKVFLNLFPNPKSLTKLPSQRYKIIDCC